jgi:CheY-like chemotaxis protein
MSDFQILIVEDDEKTRESWERDIRGFNRESENGVRFCATFAATKTEALRLLERTRFDCAVVDLRLPEGNGDPGTGQPLGNDVLDVLLDKAGIPAVVYSGFDGEASEAVKTSNIKVLLKEGGVPEKILRDFAAQAGLMTAMESTRRRVAEETARIFNQSIWRRWERRWAAESNPEHIAQVIARQTTSHIADALSQSAEYHHPEEFYVVPALYPERLDTGDLLVWGGNVLVVLTPRCNLANKPPDHITLAVCGELEKWGQWKESLLNGSAKDKDRAAKEIRLHATQGHGIASHFLPPLDDRGPWIADFQEIRTVPSAAVTELLPARFASIAPHFVPNLVQRYSAYLGRIGQPDIDSGLLMQLCKSNTPDGNGHG